MYEIKPIFDKTKVELDLPTCMYKVKTVYGNDSKQSTASPQLTNGFNGAVSHLSTDLQLDISQQIKNVLKVLLFELISIQLFFNLIHSFWLDYSFRHAILC